MSEVQKLMESLKALKGETVKVGTIVACLSVEGFPAALLTMALVVMAFPIPSMPPLNFFYTLPFAYLGWMMVKGDQKLCVPDWLANRQIKRRKLNKAADRIEKLITRIESRAKASGQRFAQHRFTSRLVGAAVLLLTFSIVLPIPGTASGPSFLIALMALGLIYKDGRLIATGLAGAMLWMIFLTTILGEAADEIGDAAEYIYKVFQ